MHGVHGGAGRETERVRVLVELQRFPAFLVLRGDEGDEPRQRPRQRVPIDGRESGSGKGGGEGERQRDREKR